MNRKNKEARKAAKRLLKGNNSKTYGMDVSTIVRYVLDREK